jgi:segregation and condensation protein A
MEYKFIINDFEGPLDLLLHLIKEADISIYDINIVDITKQYLEFINNMEKMDLDIASEYIIMAAELIEIKSRTLLPSLTSEEEDEYEEDPRDNLIRRLVEYNNYKQLTEQFKIFETSQKDFYTKEPSSLKEFMIEDIMETSEVGISELMMALEKFLSRKDEDRPLNTTITHKEYSVFERSQEIKDLLKLRKKVNFVDLFTVTTKEYIIVTFLAILDLARRNSITIKQDNNFTDIYLLSGGVEE